MTLGNAPVAREGFSPGPEGPDGNTRAYNHTAAPVRGSCS